MAAPGYTPTEGKIPLTVHFTFPGGDECDSVRWTFGDGNGSTAITTEHTYDRIGMYFPACTCELPGANASYTYDYVYAVPWSSSIRESETGGRPKRSEVTRSSEGLSTEDLIKQADGLAAIGETRYAADAYADLSTSPDLDAPILTRYGDVLTALGRLQEAEAIYMRAFLSDQSGAILKKIAETQFSLGKTIEAIETMNRTLALAPDDPASYASHAAFLQKAGKTSEALEAYNQSIALNDQQPELWARYADFLSSIGRNELAADAYQHATALGMGGSDLWNQYATILQKLGRKDEAQRAKEQAMNTYQPISSSIYGSGDGIPTCGIGSMC